MILFPTGNRRNSSSRVSAALLGIELGGLSCVALHHGSLLPLAAERYPPDVARFAKQSADVFGMRGQIEHTHKNSNAKTMRFGGRATAAGRTCQNNNGALCASVAVNRSAAPLYRQALETRGKFENSFSNYEKLYCYRRSQPQNTG